MVIMRPKRNPLEGKTLYKTPQPEMHCRYIATAHGNFYVEVEPDTSVAAPRPPQETGQAAPGEAPAPVATRSLPVARTAFPEAPSPAGKAPDLPPEPKVQPVSFNWGPPVQFAALMMRPAAASDPGRQQLDEERRTRAKQRLTDAVLKAAQTTLNEQMRYELALQAKNENVRAMALIEHEARILGISVAQLAERIIEDRRTRERRMTQVYAILARASAEIDSVSGQAIDALADTGIKEISSMEE